MGSNSNPILFLVTVFFASQPSQTLAHWIPDAYDTLKAYDLPIVILSEGMKDYELDTSTSRFAACFNEIYNFSIEGLYKLRFGSTIIGHIFKGVVSELEGVSVNLLLVWVDIVEVRRSGDDLKFFVEIASADFPVDSL